MVEMARILRLVKMARLAKVAKMARLAKMAKMEVRIPMSLIKKSKKRCL